MSTKSRDSTTSMRHDRVHDSRTGEEGVKGSMFLSKAKVERFISTPCIGSNESGPMICKRRVEASC